MLADLRCSHYRELFNKRSTTQRFRRRIRQSGSACFVFPAAASSERTFPCAVTYQSALAARTHIPSTSQGRDRTRSKRKNTLGLCVSLQIGKTSMFGHSNMPNATDAMHRNNTRKGRLTSSACLQCRRRKVKVARPAKLYHTICYYREHQND